MCSVCIMCSAYIICSADCIAFGSLYSYYGVATISRMLKNICLFAEYRSLL